MKENILYAYHISPSDIKDYPEFSNFSYNDKNYYFSLVKRDEKNFKILLEVMQELQMRKSNIFPFIMNVFGSYLTKVDNKNYVLIEMTDEQKEYDLFDIINFQREYTATNKVVSLYQNDWGSLWSSKVDYLEYQMSELGKNFPTLLNSFSYYVGLAENAISYVNSLNRRFPKEHSILVLAHKRVPYPNLRLNFDNPLNLLLDVYERDIGEYLKNLFFYNEKDALIDLKAYIEIRKPSAYQMGLLFARLLYPSYYFDIHEKIIENNLDADKVLDYTDKVNDYENFLKDAFSLMNQYAPLEKIDWLIKKES